MALIKKISQASRNGDISTLLTLSLKTLAKNDWSNDVYLTPIIEKLEANNSQMIEALNRLKIYSQMADQDFVRDTILRDLFKLVEGYAHIPMTEIKEAALLVNNIFEQYGLNIQYEDYAEESADIESLLNDLNKTSIATATSKMQGVTETIASLTEAQAKFENLALKQAEGESTKKDLVSASNLKKDSILELNSNLVGYMNTMAKVNPAIYGATAKTIAELVDKNNELTKRRKKTNEPDTELN